MRGGERDELNLERLDAILSGSLSGLAPSPGFERGVMERVDTLAARRAWVRPVILDGVGCLGLALAAFTALDYLLTQPGVQSALPQLGVYGAWAAGGVGFAYVLWSGLKAQTR